MFEKPSFLLTDPNCHCSSTFCLSLFILFRIAWWPSAGKELSSLLSPSAGLLHAVLIVCVPRAGCGIQLHEGLDGGF